MSINEAHAAWLPYALPRTQAEGSYVSYNDQLIGDVDSLLAVYGNNEGFVFGDVTGRYSSNSSWLASPGIGLRRIHNNNLLGVYGFADYQQTNPKARFWVINPGLEWMTPVWDAHVNGYFPTQRDKIVGPEVIASSVGNSNFLQFAGHGQTDALLVPTVGIGRGVDAEIGYSVDLNGYRARLFGGGNYYRQKYVAMKNIKGAVAGVQLPLNHYADVLLTNSYDNLNYNRVALTLRMTWGGNRSYSHQVQDRLLDRVERHVGLIDTGAGSIAQQGLIDTGRRASLMNNIWFFIPGATPPTFQAMAPNAPATPLTANDCTIEHPCNNFGQSAVNDIQNIAPNALFYMAPGSYSLSDSPLTMYSGQTVYGRTSNYVAPATGTMRALLIGGIQAPGNNTFDSLRMQNNGVVMFNSPTMGDGIAALYLTQANRRQTVYVTNSAIHANAALSGPSTNPGYVSGIAAKGGTLIVQNSTIGGVNSSTDAVSSSAIGATGIHAFGGAQVMVKENSVVSASSTGYNANGIYINEASSLDISNSSSTGYMNGINSSYGISIEGLSRATISNALIKTEGNGAFNTALLVNDSHITVNNSQALANNSGAGQARGLGLQSSSTTTISSTATINDSRFRADALSGNSIGMFVSGLSNLELTNSVAIANNQSAGATGLTVQSGANAEVRNSNFTATSSGPTARGTTIAADGKLTMHGGTLNANMTGAGEAHSAYLIIDNSEATFDNVVMKADSSGSFAIGLLMFNNTKANIMNNSTITATMTGSGTSSGIQTVQSSSASVTNSQITSISSGSRAYGILTRDDRLPVLSSVSLSNSNVKVIMNGSGLTQALSNNGAGSAINFTNGRIDITGPASSSINGGNNPSGISFNGSNQCTINGGTVNCAPQ